MILLNNTLFQLPTHIITSSSNEAFLSCYDLIHRGKGSCWGRAYQSRQGTTGGVKLHAGDLMAFGSEMTGGGTGLCTGFHKGLILSYI